MGMWFRRPNCLRLHQAGYRFWLREGYARVTQNARRFWIDESKWDIRFFPVLLIIVPINYLIVPFRTGAVKAHAFKQIGDIDGLTLASETNVQLMKQWTKELETAGCDTE